MTQPPLKNEESNYHPGELAALSAAAIRSFVVDKHEKGEIKVEPDYVLIRCQDAVQALERCADYINFLEEELEDLEEQNDGLRNSLRRKKRKPVQE